MVAMPHAQTAINNSRLLLFTLIEYVMDQWIFENKEYDFPQRVIYTRQQGSLMMVWIEGEMGGKQMKDEYYMKKIK